MLEWIYPPNRIQALLASAAGEESWEPDYTTLEAPRIELYLRKINGEDVQLPEYPVTTIEKFLAYKCGEDVELPEPMTRLEMLLAKDTPVEPAELPEPQTMIEYYVLNMQAGGGVELTVTGNAPVTLANAIAHAIVSLTQEGKVTQASTHTPSAPKDIVCNNGALKMVDDELPTGYKRVLGFTCDNNAMWQIDGFHLKGSDTVRISFSVEAACNVWGCYQGTDANDNYDLYASVSAGSKYLRYGNGTYLSYFSAENLGQRFDTVVTPTGTSGMPQNSTWTPKTFTAANDLLIGSTTVSGTSSKLKGNLYGNIIVDGRLKLIPCERVSDNVLGYYDTYSETFYEPYEGYDGAVSLGYDGSHYHRETVGTPETLTLAGINLLNPSASNIIIGETINSQGVSTASDNNWRSENIPVVAGKSYAFCGRKKSGNTISAYNRFNFYEADGTPITPRPSYTQGQPIIATAPANAAYVRISCAPYNASAAITRVTFDEFNWTLAEGNAEVTYEPYIAPQTASVADLYAVGNYKDTQEIIGGTVTRKVGAYVFDGTEQLSTSTAYGSAILLTSAASSWGAVKNSTPLCTHFTGLAMISSGTAAENTCFFNASGHFYFRTSMSKTDFATFLAEQYAAGTPVIVLYPLAEETTEQVTPQRLHTAAGTNTVSVTSEVDPVTLTVVYKGTEDGGSISGADDPGEVPFD